MMLATQTENAKLGALGIEFPQPYNAAVDLVERNLRAGRADKIAVLDDQGSYTYAQVADRVNRFAGALHAFNEQGLRLHAAGQPCTSAGGI